MGLTTTTTTNKTRPDDDDDGDGATTDRAASAAQGQWAAGGWLAARLKMSHAGAGHSRGPRLQQPGRPQNAPDGWGIPAYTTPPPPPPPCLVRRASLPTAGTRPAFQTRQAGEDKKAASSASSLPSRRFQSSRVLPRPLSPPSSPSSPPRRRPVDIALPLSIPCSPGPAGRRACCPRPSPAVFWKDLASRLARSLVSPIVRLFFRAGAGLRVVYLLRAR